MREEEYKKIGKERNWEGMRNSGRNTGDDLCELNTQEASQLMKHR